MAFRTGLLLAFFLAVSPRALAAGRAEVEVDRVAIASRLVADGLYDRAATVLDELSEPPEDDLLRYHTLRGLVALQLGDHAGALASFDAAVALEGAEPMLHVQRAQALHQLRRPAATLQALDLAGEAAAGLPGAWQLRARAHRELSDEDAAWAALVAGRDAFPEHRGLAEDQLLQLVDLGLTRSALEVANELEALGSGVELWIAVGERLRRAGALADAMAFLEDARTRFPAAVEPRVALASACLDAERPHCAGSLLEEASAFDPTYASEAAECFRRAGEIDRALYLNGQVQDEQVKVRQRLGLLLEQERFDQAAALDPRLQRLGLLDDEELRYALAYAHFQTRGYDRAEELLTGLSTPHLFRQATGLREAMDRCRRGEGGCG
jgi:hypothetical protein